MVYCLNHRVLSFKYEEEKKDTGMTALAGLPVYLDLASVSDRTCSKSSLPPLPGPAHPNSYWLIDAGLELTGQAGIMFRERLPAPARSSRVTSLRFISKKAGVAITSTVRGRGRSTGTSSKIQPGKAIDKKSLFCWGSIRVIFLLCQVNYLTNYGSELLQIKCYPSVIKI
jgi:hypothetical protein